MQTPIFPQPELKLGKLAPVHKDTDLLFVHYKDLAKDFKAAPIGYGHTSLVKNPWGMLGNDTRGDCAIAGPGHEHMLTSAIAGKQISFTTDLIIKVYSAVTGYDPNDPSTDQGSVVSDVLSYRKKIGMVDAQGNTHKIGAYVALQPGDFDELLEALYLFGAIGIGFQVPASAMSQFRNGKPWSVVAGSPIEGGHYVPVVSRPGSQLIQVVTWGALQGMTKAFYQKYCDEAWAILSPEMLAGGKSLEGFDLATLQADLALL